MSVMSVLFGICAVVVFVAVIYLGDKYVHEFKKKDGR